MNVRARQLIVVWLLALAPRGVVAQPASGPAEAAYQEGRRLYDLREWDRAIAKFKEAYEQRHDPASMFNIAQAYRLKGDCVEALAFYKTYSRNFPDASNLDKVNKFISELEPCAKQQAKTVNIEPVGAADSGSLDRRRDATSTPPPVDGRRHRRLGLWIGGGGAAFAGASLVVGALARSKWHDALAHCDASHACDTKGLALGDQASTRATIATVLGGVGLAAVAVGAILYVTAPSAPERRSAAIAPLVGSDQVGMVVEGRF